MTLYINCCPRMNSRTDRLARALLKKLGEYEELRLYDEPIRAMDPQRLPHREELLDRGELDGEIFRYSHQFAAADRIVIAAPYWDLSFPAQLYRKHLRHGHRDAVWRRWLSGGHVPGGGADLCHNVGRPL